MGPLWAGAGCHFCRPWKSGPPPNLPATRDFQSLSGCPTRQRQRQVQCLPPDQEADPPVSSLRPPRKFGLRPRRPHHVLPDLFPRRLPLCHRQNQTCPPVQVQARVCGHIPPLAHRGPGAHAGFGSGSPDRLREPARVPVTQPAFPLLLPLFRATSSAWPRTTPARADGTGRVSAWLPALVGARLTPPWKPRLRLPWVGGLRGPADASAPRAPH